jgi:hypothetical protein
MSSRNSKRTSGLAAPTVAEGTLATGTDEGAGPATDGLACAFGAAVATAHGMTGSYAAPSCILASMERTPGLLRVTSRTVTADLHAGCMMFWCKSK